MAYYRIAIVFDPLFGEKILEIAKKMYVWVIYSPTNIKYAKQIWSNPDNSIEVSIMGNEEIQPVFDNDWLDTIWSHHYDQCFDPLISEILVIGVKLSQSVRSVLDDYEFDIIEETEEYFVARDRAAITPLQ